MGGEFSRPVQTGPETHPTSCRMGTRSFPGVERPKRRADHLPLLVQGCDFVGAIPPPPLRACTDMSWDEL